MKAVGYEIGREKDGFSLDLQYVRFLRNKKKWHFLLVIWLMYGSGKPIKDYK